MNAKNINIYEFYNLYNEEAFILDFSNDNLLINFSLKVSLNSYLNSLIEFYPDNLTHLIIISPSSSSSKYEDIIKNIETMFKFKNYYFFKQHDKIELYNKFRVLFNGELNTYPSLITCLLPKMVFLGSIKTINKEFLTSNCIEKIINMTFNKFNLDIEENYPIEDEDNVDISNILDQTYNTIENYKNILIVCEKGKSRSVSVVLYYYAKKYNLPLEDALNNLRYCRSICDPNNGFKYQIKTKLDFRKCS